MEINLDIGQDTLEALNKIATINNTNITVSAVEMMAFGSRIFLQSREQKEDKLTKLLLENSVRSNEILVEILHMVFNQKTSKIGAYDAETTLAFIERLVANYAKAAY